MGSCISKCRTKRSKFKDQESSDVHDKLVVISQPPSSSPAPDADPLSLHHLLKPPSPCPSSSSSSSTTFSSFSNSASAAGSTKSSSLSSASSSSLSKDHRSSFSNEFLLSCAKENSHLIGINPTSKSTQPRMITKVHPAADSSSVLISPPVKPVAERLVTGGSAGSSPSHKKRARSNSPTLVRQKSLRREPVMRVNGGSASAANYHQLPSGKPGVLRSPSPSRRFSGGSDHFYNYRSVSTNAAATESSSSYSNHKVANFPKKSAINSPSAVKKEQYSRRSSAYTKKNKDTLMATMHQQSAAASDHHRKGTEVAVGGLSLLPPGQDMESILMEEDINNPLIALDCFIFL